MERFDYWLKALRFNRAVLKTALAQVELNNTVARMKKETDENKRIEIAGTEAVPQRIGLSEKWQEMNRILLSFVTTNGELGTTAQSVLQNGEDFYLRIRVLSESEQLSGKLYYHSLETKPYSSASLKLMGEHVFEVRVPPDKIPGDFEYYIEVLDGKGKLSYPVTAGTINNAVVIL